MKIMMANKYFFWKGGAETVYFQERDFLRSAGVKVVDFSMYDGETSQATSRITSSSNGIITLVRSAHLARRRSPCR